MLCERKVHVILENNFSSCDNLAGRKGRPGEEKEYPRKHFEVNIFFVLFFAVKGSYFGCSKNETHLHLLKAQNCVLQTFLFLSFICRLFKYPHIDLFGSLTRSVSTGLRLAIKRNSHVQVSNPLPTNVQPTPRIQEFFSFPSSFLFCQIHTYFFKITPTSRCPTHTKDPRIFSQSHLVSYFVKSTDFTNSHVQVSNPHPTHAKDPRIFLNPILFLTDFLPNSQLVFSK